MKNPSSLFMALASILLGTFAGAETHLPALFSDYMVFQRNEPCRVWGWDEPGTTVQIEFAGQSTEAVADGDGRWQASLVPMPASAVSRTLHVFGTTSVEIEDVVVGEVWICGGQSNMAWTLAKTWNGDLEALAAENSELRLLRIPSRGRQTPAKDFEGAWQRSTPESAGEFSAVGYHFGRILQRTLKVPVGLINNAWGGSTAEAWMARDFLESDPRFADLMERTRKHEAYLESPQAQEDHAAKMAAYEERKARLQAQGKRVPWPPRSPEKWMSGNKRPANGFNGSLYPIIGYTIRGTIWYQGESNASRWPEYAELFPALIEHWRELWGQGDFPFYWVQLADFMAEDAEPLNVSNWAALRDIQTATQSLPNTGQAVIIDLGEAQDIHPRHKQAVGARLARLALDRDYGFALNSRSPQYCEHHIEGREVVVEFDTFGSTLRTFDTWQIEGFDLRGEDGVWHRAEAKMRGEQAVVVISASVPDPVAVRYAWANNPVCNLLSIDGLPVTPFHTDPPPEPETNE